MGVTLRVNKLKNGSRSYYLDIIQNGQRWKETLGLYASRGNAQRVKEQAEEIRTKRALELAAEPHDLVPVHQRDNSFRDYFNNYALQYSKGDGRAVRTCAGIFERWLDGEDISFKQMNRKVVRDFKNHLEGLKLRGETAPNYLAKFKKVINQAREDGLIKSDITFKICISLKDCIPTKAKETLTDKEILALIKYPPSNNNVYRAFLFCCFTGLRTPEARNFNPGDIEWNNDVPHIDITQKKGVNPKPKLIPLTEYAYSLLGQFDPKSKKPFFALPTQNGVNKVIKGWLKKAGIAKHITFYCARHTFGTQLMASGTDARTVAALLGHSSLKYIVRYSREVDVNKIKAVNSLASPLSNKEAA